MDLYFKRLPGVLEYMEHTRAQAKEQGYVETLDGRRLYLPDINPAMVLIVQRLNVQLLTRECREPPPTYQTGNRRVDAWLPG
ncbi:DNA polymerase [Escherichia coli]